ncbi:hypothetical protein M431DRAFT_237302 [Trichoderma harzianum CBS 226.95]|uniref:Uncharacterized protein n=1 Tax=Trichoderma harzianum CBS 226.95 TaxID=983964 RepID=A0A2T4A2A7_TRIHA|nr:hypothetical protein M431DRAFT_237302 [Trichoderma harzianum CBS 226.95]PTB51196.1 hypothetical protein M431DRAFT_237302 [Trichoderma harzianum CBS 226.95]
MSILLERYEPQIQLTWDFVEAAASNPEYGLEIIELFLNRQRDQVQITEDMVKAAASKDYGGKEIIKTLS